MTADDPACGGRVPEEPGATAVFDTASLPGGPAAEVARRPDGGYVLLRWESGLLGSKCTAASEARSGDLAGVQAMADSFAAAAGLARGAAGFGGPAAPGWAGIDRIGASLRMSGPGWRFVASTLWRRTGDGPDALLHPGCAADPFAACFLATWCGRGEAAARRMTIRH